MRWRGPARKSWILYPQAKNIGSLGVKQHKSAHTDRKTFGASPQTTPVTFLGWFFFVFFYSTEKKCEY